MHTSISMEIPNELASKIDILACNTSKTQTNIILEAIARLKPKNIAL